MSSPEIIRSLNEHRTALNEALERARQSDPSHGRGVLSAQLGETVRRLQRWEAYLLELFADPVKLRALAKEAQEELYRQEVNRARREAEEELRRQAAGGLVCVNCWRPGGAMVPARDERGDQLFHQETGSQLFEHEGGCPPRRLEVSGG